MVIQVRLFVAEDAPVMSGAIQEQLQAKQARFMHIFQTSVTSVSPEDAPPGFGGVAVKPKADPAALALIVAQIPWRRPDMVSQRYVCHTGLSGLASYLSGLPRQGFQNFSWELEQNGEVVVACIALGILIGKNIQTPIFNCLDDEWRFTLILSAEMFKVQYYNVKMSITLKTD